MCKTHKNVITVQLPSTPSEPLTESIKQKELDKITAKKQKQRDYYYKRTYGLSLDTYDKIKASQNNACKICEKTDCKLVVDHCHTTERVRGLLCHNCNVALGHLRDKPEVIGKCIEYLQDSREYTVAGVPITYKAFSKQQKLKVEKI